MSVDNSYPEIAGETKVVKVVDNEGTSQTVMMTKVDGSAYPPLAEKGFRGDYVFYMVIAAGVVAAHYDPRKMVDRSPFVGRNDAAYDMMLGVHDDIIGWGEIPNGGTIDPEMLKVLLNG